MPVLPPSILSNSPCLLNFTLKYAWEEKYSRKSYNRDLLAFYFHWGTNGKKKKKDKRWIRMANQTNELEMRTDVGRVGFIELTNESRAKKTMCPSENARLTRQWQITIYNSLLLLLIIWMRILFNTSPMPLFHISFHFLFDCKLSDMKECF